jgi:hypothetical protein
MPSQDDETIGHAASEYLDDETIAQWPLRRKHGLENPDRQSHP